MSKRMITLGKWNDTPIEWIVLKEESFGVLVISKGSIGDFQFNSNNNGDWASSSLRKYLNETFFVTVFDNEEKKKIVNSHLDKSKDNVFLLTESEVRELLLKGGSDSYEDSHTHDACSWCCWTRSENGSTARQGYARGCWCNRNKTSLYRIRPAMYIKE